MIEVAYNRLVDSQKQQSRERWPVNASGQPYCAEHAYELTADDWYCQPCTKAKEAARRAEAARERRLSSVHSWFEESSQLHGAAYRYGSSEQDLGMMPRWKHARFSNPQWIDNCDKRVLRAIRDWDMRTWITVFAGTGAGKTSGFVARVYAELDRALPAAEVGPFDLPPRFLYTTGYELGEANKSRRLGQDEHELVRAAKRRPLLVLDELHPIHTPRDVAFAVIDTRLREGLPTAILAGMDRATFGKEYGAHTLRRLLDFKHVDVFPVGGATVETRNHGGE